MQGLPLNWITSIARGLCFWTQFMSSQGPLLLFVISWIFESKKSHFVFLMLFLNFFQSSIYLDCQKCSRSLWYCSFHHSFECSVILMIFECLYYNLSVALANSWTIWSRIFSLWMFSVFISLIVSISSFMNLSSSSLFLTSVHLLVWIHF